MGVQWRVKLVRRVFEERKVEAVPYKVHTAQHMPSVVYIST